MFAVYAESFSTDEPLSGLVVGERPAPEAPEGWTTVTVKAASLNHHDLWSLRGVGLREEALPMILGCDAAGLDEDGNEVVVHAVVSDPSWTGDETLDPKRSLLSERYQGTFADKVVVPKGNVVPKPASLSFEVAGKWMSADTVNVSASGSSVAKGESLRDTALTLSAMGADCVIVRHPASGAAHRLAAWLDKDRGTTGTPTVIVTASKVRVAR